MTTTFTTNAIVLAAIDGTKTGLTTDEIDTIINMNEGFITALFKIESDFTFSASNAKHLILRKMVTAMTCIDVVAASMSWNALGEIEALLDKFVMEYQECLKFMEKQDLMKFLGE